MVRWEMESWVTKKWGIGEKRLRTHALEHVEVAISIHHKEWTPYCHTVNWYALCRVYSVPI